ncbi:MAG: ATP-dependent helicase, partial [Mesorhizobium sp.]
KDEDRKPRGERQKDRHAKHDEAPDAAREERPVAEVADIAERRARKDAIRSENDRKGSANRNEQRGDGRPQRDRPARHRQEEDDATVGFGDDVPAFMRIVAKV